LEKKKLSCRRLFYTYLWETRFVAPTGSPFWGYGYHGIAIAAIAPIRKNLPDGNRNVPMAGASEISRISAESPLNSSAKPEGFYANPRKLCERLYLISITSCNPLQSIIIHPTY